MAAVVISDDAVPVNTIDRLPPAVLTGSTLLCTLLVSATLPEVSYLAEVDSGDIAAADPAEVAVSHSIVSNEVRLAFGPASFTDVEDVTVTGAVWSFHEASVTWASQATAVGAADRVIWSMLLDDPLVITTAVDLEISPDGYIAIHQAAP